MTTEAEHVAKLAVQAAGASTVKSTDGLREFLLVPDGFTMKDISDEHSLHVSKPVYIAQEVTLQTQDSLVDYVDRFKSPGSMLFADVEVDKIAAWIDYHEKDNASNMAHRALLALARSEEWRLWNGISGKLQDQLTFARFIEENAADIRAPAAGELLDAVRDLQVHRKVNFIKAVRTQSDNENFEYSEETNATGKRGELEIPTKFVLGLPVYFGEPDVELHAFLRWKLDEGRLTLGVQLHRVEHVRQAVFKQIVAGIAERTKCLAVFGKL
jgi:uncharacterized protein YfdQ (DUF2303 family)